MSDFNSLLTTANYAELMQAIKDIMEKQAKLDLSTVSNIPLGTMRINPSTKVFEKFNGTTWEAFTLSEIEALQTAVSGKEPVISPKNSGFNLNKSDSYALDNSDNLATSKAIKDGLDTKEPVITPKNSGFNLNKSDSYTVSDTNKLATSKAMVDGLATKETSFSKNSAFNKNFGTIAGTVAEGNHVHGDFSNYSIDLSNTGVATTANELISLLNNSTVTVIYIYGTLTIDIEDYKDLVTFTSNKELTLIGINSMPTLYFFDRSSISNSVTTSNFDAFFKCAGIITLKNLNCKVRGVFGGSYKSVTETINKPIMFENCVIDVYGENIYGRAYMSLVLSKFTYCLNCLLKSHGEDSDIYSSIIFSNGVHLSNCWYSISLNSAIKNYINSNYYNIDTTRIENL